MKPLFIVLEGLDGSGTSTQSLLLEDHFRSRQTPIMSTCEPSTGIIGSVIRLALKRRVKFQDDAKQFDRQMALMFAADRHDHLYNDVEGIIPTLKRGITVICTRYIPSSFAYHCASESDWEFVNNLNSEFPMPDLLVYLDNKVENSLNRITSRVVLDAYEQETKLSQAELNYQRYISNYRGNKLTIDASLSKNEISSLIVERIEKISSSRTKE